MVAILKKIVWFSNGWAEVKAKSIVPTILKPNFLNGRHLFGFQLVGLLGIQMAIKNWPI